MAASTMHVLYEHASGYAIFRVKECEEVAMLQPEVEESVTDLSRFNSIVKLIAFAPFKSGTNALDNINCISEGVLHDDLRLFLETNVPKPTKKQKSILGIGDSKIGGAIMDELGLPSQHTGIVPEIIRGIRAHFGKLVKGLTEVTAAKAQLGLGHSYSRAKVKFNVNRSDNMIIQSIALLDQLDKDVNTFSMRIREWYSYHFPELVKIVPDNYTFSRCVKYIMNRKEFTEEMLSPGLEEIVMDSAKARAIWDASRASMGMDISPIDLINIERFALRVIDLSDYRKKLHVYLQQKMTAVAPNLATLIGEQVGARLISHAGSLTNLAKYPASTVQILGAEKALFRALKTRGNTPKYGLIFHSTFIGRAGAKNKGRISRYLANKCSIASRIDCFSDIPSSVFGEHLKQQVEDRLKFYETGDAPEKNIDVMKRAIAEAEVVAAEALRQEKKKKKKDKKRQSAATNGDADVTMEETKPDVVSPADVKEEDSKPEVTTEPKAEVVTPGKRKKDTVKNEVVEAGEPPVKKKKKIKVENSTALDSTLDSTLDTTTELFESVVEEPAKKKKKKQSKADESSTALESTLNSTLDTTAEESVVVEKPAKKKKIKQSKADEGTAALESTLNSTLDTTAEKSMVEEPAKKKKKKRNKADESSAALECTLNSTLDTTAEESVVMEPPVKKKKKSKAADDSAPLDSTLNTTAEDSIVAEAGGDAPKKKKKKKQSQVEESAPLDSTLDSTTEENVAVEEPAMKKKKKQNKDDKSSAALESTLNSTLDTTAEEPMEKKKKKSKSSASLDSTLNSTSEEAPEKKKKKKKERRNV